jgi:hypothetical protein
MFINKLIMLIRVTNEREKEIVYILSRQKYIILFENDLVIFFRQKG